MVSAMGDQLIKLIGLAISIGAFYFAWSRHRNDEVKHNEIELRRDDVFRWSNEVISCLQSLSLLTRIGGKHLGEVEVQSRITEIIFESSLRIERGRLLFKNGTANGYGDHRPGAYRGFRPIILDKILISYLVACEWKQADDETRVKLGILAYDAERDFVSLVQKEIGRGLAIAPDAIRAGDSIRLPYLLEQISLERLRSVRQYRS